MAQKTCPYCMSDTGMRIIFYGLPMEEPDPAIYTIGGCFVSDEMPKYECIECGWKGSRTKLRKSDRGNQRIAK